MTPESILFQALLAAGLLPLAVLLRRRGARGSGLCALALWAATAAWAASGRAPAGRAQPAPADRPLAVEELGYVSSTACQACHPGQYDSWHDSYHRRMTQVASPEAIVAPFDGREVIFDGLLYRLERVGDEFWVEMPDPDQPRSAPRVRKQVVLLTGSHHEQDFWYAAGQGRGVRRVPIVYRIAEDRWLPNEAVFLRPPSARYGDEAMPPNEWNVSCIKCHATHGRPGFDAEGGQWAQTLVAEFGIACEACHGPAQEHVGANHDPLERYAQHLAAEPLADRPEPTIVDPSDLSPARSAEICGQCHSITGFDDADGLRQWAAHGTSYRPGATLADAGRHVVRTAEADTNEALRRQIEREPTFLADRFWDDGTVRVSGREHNGLIESPCFRDGSQPDDLSCLACHVMHQKEDDPRPAHEWADDQLGLGMDGDAACLQCHAEVGERLEEHTHHAAGSAGSRCYDCHMPYTTLGLLKAIRSHRIDSPSAAASLRSRRPDACSLCHLDQSRVWVAEHLSAWYGAPPLTDAGLLARVPAVLAFALAGDAGLRDLAAWHMGWAPAREAAGERWMVPLLIELLADPYAAVRFNAGRSLESLAGFAELGYDFVGGYAAIRDAQRRALELQRAAGGPTELSALFEGCDAAVIEDLLRARDQRPVHLKE